MYHHEHQQPHPGFCLVTSTLYGHVNSSNHDIHAGHIMAKLHQDHIVNTVCPVNHGHIHAHVRLSEQVVRVTISVLSVSYHQEKRGSQVLLCFVIYGMNWKFTFHSVQNLTLQLHLCEKKNSATLQWMTSAKNISSTFPDELYSEFIQRKCVQYHEEHYLVPL